MNFLDELEDKSKWIEFYEKLNDEVQPDKKLNEKVLNIITNNEFINFKELILNNQFFENKARKLEIPKLGTKKKRVVYSYNFKQKILLKFVNFCLRKYDYLFTDNLFSYRTKIYPHHISKIIHNIVKQNKYYAYKIDIHDYFRSINVDRLIKLIDEKIDDKPLVKFLDTLVHQDEFLQNNKIIKEDAGAVPGMSISGFFANLYLSEIDKFFLDSGKIYFRYADDIILFNESKEDLLSDLQVLKNRVYEKGLEMNPKKDHFYDIGDSIEFLGLKYSGNIIDISDISFLKIKGKIRRSSRSFRRWMIKKNVSYGQTLYAFNKKFNKRFYSKVDGEICWALWYFPSINTDVTLSKIDEYYQQQARYIKTGKHSKLNYKVVSYEYLKKYHYKPLKTAYYNFKKTGSVLKFLNSDL